VKKLLFLALFLAALYFAGSFARAAWIGTPSAGNPLAVVIPAHATPEDIARILTDTHVIASPRAYVIYAVLDAKARNPRAGAYELPPGASFHAIARALALRRYRERNDLPASSIAVSCRGA
jgi:cell division protein YceG involved in septum cleavage